MADLTHYREQLLGAIADDGTGNWLNLLVDAGFQVRPHVRGVEFEMKFRPNAVDRGSLGDYAQALTRVADLPEGVIAPAWLVHSEMTVDFWLRGESEWSRRRLPGRADVLKLKRHEFFPHASSGLSVVQSTEEFIRDAVLVDEKVGQLGDPTGTMRKTRAKGHYVNLSDGVVFNVVESRCQIGRAEQVQIELEYGAHVYPRGSDPDAEDTESMIRERLWKLHRLLLPCFDDVALVPTDELKREFLAENAGH